MGRLLAGRTNVRYVDFKRHLAKISPETALLGLHNRVFEPRKTKQFNRK